MKVRVLLGDDHALILDGIRAALQLQYEIVGLAKDGRALVDAAERLKPDLVILDISMPEETGVRMYRNLKGDPQTAAIPVVVLTGISHEFKRFIETRRQVPPPEGYFDKPPDRTEFLAKVKELLGARNLKASASK